MSASELMAMMAQAGFTHIETVPNAMPLQTQILVGRKSRAVGSSASTAFH